MLQYDMMGRLHQLTIQTLTQLSIIFIQHYSRVQVRQGFKLSKSIDDSSSHSLISDNPPFIFATFDGLELLPHGGILDGNP